MLRNEGVWGARNPKFRSSISQNGEKIEIKVLRITCLTICNHALLWKGSRWKILTKAISMQNISLTFLYTNPYSSRNHDPTVNTLEARLCGLPLSVDESAVVELLPLWAITLVDAVLHYGQLKPSRNTAVLSAGILDIREITVKTNPVVKICKTPSHKQGDTMCSLYQIQESFISLNGKIAFCQILNHVSSISSENNTS